MADRQLLEIESMESPKESYDFGVDEPEIKLNDRIHEIFDKEKKELGSDTESTIIIDAIATIDFECTRILSENESEQQERTTATTIQHQLSLLKQTLLNEKFRKIKASHFLYGNNEDQALREEFLTLLHTHKQTLSDLLTPYQPLLQPAIEQEADNSENSSCLRALVAGLFILIGALGGAMIGLLVAGPSGGIAGGIKGAIKGGSLAGATGGAGGGIVGGLAYYFRGYNTFFPPEDIILPSPMKTIALSSKELVNAFNKRLPAKR